MTPSDDTAGAETPTTDETVTIDSLRDLLSVGEEPAEPGISPDVDEGGSLEEPLTQFNDLAGRLGVELDALYKLEVSQAEDGTPVTIETLKDAYAKQGDVTLRELQFEERRTKQEAELIQAQDELRELMAALPERSIRPEALEKLRETHAAKMDLERQKTLEVIPEWRDDATRTKDIEGMVNHLKQYGYPVDHLGRVADHRQMKYIRDNYLREQRIRAALAKVKAGKPQPTPESRPTGKAPLKRPLAGVSRGNAFNKLEAVFSELD